MQPNVCLKAKTFKCVWCVPHLCASVNQQVRSLSLAAFWNEKYTNSALGMGRFNQRDSCLHERKADKFSHDAISTIHKVICWNASRMQKACGLSEIWKFRQFTAKGNMWWSGQMNLVSRPLHHIISIGKFANKMNHTFQHIYLVQAYHTVQIVHKVLQWFA